MAIRTLKCSDGSSDCNGTLDAFVRLSGLTQAQLDEISDEGGTAEIELSPEQVRLNQQAGILTQDELEMCETDGSLFIEVSAGTICSGCGSDVSRNAEGRAIPG
jgi:hypothetical protein